MERRLEIWGVKERKKGSSVWLVQMGQNALSVLNEIIQNDLGKIKLEKEAIL